MFLLDASINAIAGLGPKAAQLINSRAEQKEPNPVQIRSQQLTDLALDQAHIALQMLEVVKGSTVIEFAKGAKGKSPQAELVKEKVKLLVMPGYKSSSAYSGEGTKFDESKGKLTIGKSSVNVTASAAIKDSKAEIAELRKTDKDGTTAMDASMKCENSLGMYYTAIFQAKNPAAKAKASKNLDSALKALKDIKPAKKNAALTEAQRSYLIVNLAIIQALANKSGGILGQQALLAQLKQYADAGKPGTVDELAKDLISEADQTVNAQGQQTGDQVGLANQQQNSGKQQRSRAGAQAQAV